MKTAFGESAPSPGRRFSFWMAQGRCPIKWFKHDSDACSDAKIKRLILRFGPVGYAVYFHCLELIAGDVSETNMTFELEHDSEIIADNLKVKGTSEKSGIEIVEDIMKFCISQELFSESDSRVFCFKMLKRLDASMTSNAAMRRMIAKAKESHDPVMTQSCFSHDSVMLEETRLEEKRREAEEAEAKPQPPEKIVSISNTNITARFFQLANRQPNAFERTLLVEMQKTYTTEDLTHAFKEAGENGVSNLKYVKAILEKRGTKEDRDSRWDFISEK